MYNNTQASVQNNPSAYITVRKGRAKIYDKEKQPSKVFLQGGQEFELELFNPTTSHQLATVEINGKLISETGVALKPGQRIYLERYLDVAKKFKFDTYEVDAGNASVEKAIANNGLIKIKFYTEIPTKPTISKSSNLLGGTISTSGINTLNTTGTTLNGYTFNASNSTGNVTFTNTLYSPTLNLDGIINTLNSTMYTNIGESSNYTLEEPIEVKTKETGRVEQGSSSTQTFDYIDMDFSILANTTIEYQILPLSEKILEAKDLKNYCTECGRGLKPEFKFCPACGTKN